MILTMLKDWLDDDGALRKLFVDDGIRVPDNSKQIQMLRIILESGEPGELRAQIQDIVERIDLSRTQIRITLTRNAIANLYAVNPDELSERPLTIDREITLKRRGVEQKVVQVDGFPVKRRQDQSLCKLIAQARCWFDELAYGRIDSVGAIAERENRDGSDISRVLQLAFLAPEIVGATLSGRQANPDDHTYPHTSRHTAIRLQSATSIAVLHYLSINTPSRQHRVRELAGHRNRLAETFVESHYRRRP